jgi:hypothetical protein
MAMRREQIAAALKYVGDKANLRQRFERATSLDPQEQDMADIAVETGASFIPVVGQALAARDVERARRANDPAGMAMASMGAIPGGRLAGLLKRYDPVMQQLDVYHGTPHKFPATEANPLGEFDASKIGTGEGAQAYGHGIYYAENPNVAQSYTAAGGSTTNVPQSYAADVVGMMGGEQKAIEHLKRIMPPKGEKTFSGESREFIEQTLRDVESGAYKAKQGSLYKADLPDEMIDRMLDWDKPLKEQPFKMQQAIFNDLTDAGYSKAVVNDLLNRKTGMEFFKTLHTGLQQGESSAINLAKKLNLSEQEMFMDAPALASAVMRRMGIFGIRYLDAGSRGQGGSGTRNFVVFPGEEKKVRILERK